MRRDEARTCCRDDVASGTCVKPDIAIPSARSLLVSVGRSPLQTRFEVFVSLTGLVPTIEMRAEGLEPPRSFDHEDLNLARLPKVPPRPLGPPVYASPGRPFVTGGPAAFRSGARATACSGRALSAHPEVSSYRRGSTCTCSASTWATAISLAAPGRIASGSSSTGHTQESFEPAGRRSRRSGRPSGLGIGGPLRAAVTSSRCALTIGPACFRNTGPAESTNERSRWQIGKSGS